MRDLPVLGFAVGATECRALEPLQVTLRSVSLFGRYAEAHESGVDARDLTRYAEASFSGVYASCLFDYFLEHRQALSEMYRVVAPGGWLLTHIAGFRLRLDASEPSVIRVLEPAPGFYDYLPADAKMLSVRVGTKWLLQTMGDVGWARCGLAHYVDESSGTPCDWFYAQKPLAEELAISGIQRGEQAALEDESSTDPSPEIPSVPDAQHPILPPSRARTSGLSKEYAVPLPETGRVFRMRLTVPQVEVHRGYARFAEHVLSPDRSESTETVIAAGIGCLHCSEDLGMSWQVIHIRGFEEAKFNHCFTLPDGRRLVQVRQLSQPDQDRDSGMIVTCDATGEVHSVFRPSVTARDGRGVPWHGTSSIDRSGEVIMYAEYSSNTLGKRSTWRPSRVLRSVDGGETWETVLEVDGSMIRHFHVVRAQPDAPGTWWLTSGDHAAECRIWRTEDHGDNWEDLTATDASLAGLAGAPFGRLAFRLTDVAFTPRDTLLWGSDDTLGQRIDPALPLSQRGGSRVFETPLHGALAVREVGYCGQAVRTIVDCGECYVLITQAIPLPHTTRPSVHAIFKDDLERCLEIVKVDRYTSAVTSFTASRSSRFAKRGTFYTYRGPADAFSHPLGVLRWDISFD
ncbi:MAG: methyltransferase domain-containing protein [Solirubrobacteraceae bacterium]